MLNSFPKYQTRDLPGLKTYLERKGKLPEGLVLGLAVMWFLVMPQHNKNADDESRNVKIAYSEEIANKNTKLSSLQDEVDSLTT